MSELEQRMGAILNDPQMMQKIMAMAQSLGNAPSPEKSEPQPAQPSEPAFSIQESELALLKQLSGFAGKSRIDSNQQSLLHALKPYLSAARIGKLERAMRAAKMASMASVFLGNNAFLSNIGR